MKDQTMKDHNEDETIMQRRLAELREIEAANNGVILPEQVVRRAKNPASALHSAFDWNDTDAARKYRLEQARQLIRVVVEFSPQTGENVRAYVSVLSDRVSGGYRHLPTMMKTEKGRGSILETALAELEAFQQKYSTLQELAAVFAAVRTVKSTTRKIKMTTAQTKGKK